MGKARFVEDASVDREPTTKKPGEKKGRPRIFSQKLGREMVAGAGRE